MNNSEHTPFLGRGWSFPPKFNEHNHRIQMVSDDEDIRQSLFILLSTIPGERMMQFEYGCDLHSQVFNGIDSTTIGIIKDLIFTAVLNYEPRITLEEVNIDTSEEIEGKLLIEMFYTIRKINVRTNIVYPFYFLEGTDIPDR